MPFVPLARLHALDEGVPCPARAAGREFLLIRQAGRIRIFDARCPHAGHSLLRGQVAGGAVRCPGHGLEFDLASGACRQAGACPALTAFPPVFRDKDVGIELA